VKYEDLAYASLNGFAAMGTNNGHNGTTGITMLNNPDIIEDFAYRAYVHLIYPKFELSLTSKVFTPALFRESS
jgi:hypothetical protein